MKPMGNCVTKILRAASSLLINHFIATQRTTVLLYGSDSLKFDRAQIVKDVSRLLWTPKFHYRLCNGLPLEHILNHTTIFISDLF